MKSRVRIVGDVHGGRNLQAYAELVKEAETKGMKTLQIGDMAFSYDHFEHFDLGPDDHVFIGGNHDNYDIYHDCPNALGDYGLEELNGLEFFFVRGAWSIDQFYRTPGVSWWPDEELSVERLREAHRLYVESRPRVMVTHDAPDSVIKLLGPRSTNTTRTGSFLERMFQAHQPKIWIFGHWHVDCVEIVEGTKFVCLDELSFLDI
jgi:predicted phosphodiesterase